MLEIINITDMSLFLDSVKKETIFAFMTTFDDLEDYITENYEEILTYEEIQWECKRYFILDNETRKYSVYKKDFNKILKDMYKYLVCKMLNKQVDEGKLLLCWDKKKKEFLWTKPKTEKYRKKENDS